MTKVDPITIQGTNAANRLIVRSQRGSDDYRELYIEASTQIAMHEAKVADVEKQIADVLAIDEELRKKDRQNEADLNKMRTILADLLRLMDTVVEGDVNSVEAVRVAMNFSVFNRVV